MPLKLNNKGTIKVFIKGKMAYNNDGQGGFNPRKMYQGNWKCAKCGAEITELPFEPDPEKSDRLMCRDCFREKRKSFRRGSSPFRR